MPRCRGICPKYKCSPRYKNGQRNCRVCCMFIKCDGVRCPCCASVLSNNPSKAKHRNRLKIERGVTEL